MSFTNNTYMQHLSKLYNDNKNLCVYPLNKKNSSKQFNFIKTNINDWVNPKDSENYNAKKFINGVELLIEYLTKEINKNYWNFRFDEYFIKTENNTLQSVLEFESVSPYRISLDDAYIVFTNSIFAPLYVTFIKRRSVKTKNVNSDSNNIINLHNTVGLSDRRFLSKDLNNYGNIFNSTETYFISIEKLMNCDSLYDCHDLINTSEGEIRLYNFNNNLFFDYAVSLDKMVKPSMVNSVGKKTITNLRNTCHLKCESDVEIQLEEMYKAAEALYKFVLSSYKK